MTPLTVHGLSRFRSEEHTSELQSLMRISYAVFHRVLHVRTHSFPARRSSVLGRPGRQFTFSCGRVLTVFCGWLPRCKHKLTFGVLVGCSRLSGLLMQSVGTAGPDGVREPGPDRLIRL